MWIVIIAVILVIAFLVFRHYDRDFIKAVKNEDGDYTLSFESGKEATFLLADTFRVDKKDFRVFVLTENLNDVLPENVLVLKLYRKKEHYDVFVFANKEENVRVLELFLVKYENNAYSNKFFLNPIDDD